MLIVFFLYVCVNVTLIPFTSWKRNIIVNKWKTNKKIDRVLSMAQKLLKANMYFKSDKLLNFVPFFYIIKIANYNFSYLLISDNW